jgi:hypothetical protein
VKIIAQKVDARGTGLNGAFSLTLPMGVVLVFAGAPFRMSETAFLTHLEPAGSPTFTVKCATEVAGAADTTVPCEDYGTAKPADLRDAAEEAIEAAFQGRPVFAGCMGGIGRTGVFLSVVLKAFYPDVDETEIVPMLRNLYLPYTVETPEQEKLVQCIDLEKLQGRIKWLWLKAVIRKTFGQKFPDLSSLHAGDYSYA